MADYVLYKGDDKCDEVREFTANLVRMTIWRAPDGTVAVLPSRKADIKASTIERLKEFGFTIGKPAGAGAGAT